MMLATIKRMTAKGRAISNPAAIKKKLPKTTKRSATNAHAYLNLPSSEKTSFFQRITKMIANASIPIHPMNPSNRLSVFVPPWRLAIHKNPVGYVVVWPRRLDFLYPE